MDWYAWLCKAGLQPDVAFRYALLFARNELVAADVRHLDHGFLAAMGVAVAKHRLEILKLARRESSSSTSFSVAVLPLRATRLLAAVVHRSALSLAGCFLSVARRDRAAVAVAPRQPLWKPPRASPSPSSSSAARRGGRKMALLRHLSKPVLTNYGGGKRIRTRNSSTAYMAVPATAAITGCFSNPVAYSRNYDDDDDEDMRMRWESMFQDLKPT